MKFTRGELADLYSRPVAGNFKNLLTSPTNITPEGDFMHPRPFFTPTEPPPSTWSASIHMLDTDVHVTWKI